MNDGPHARLNPIQRLLADAASRGVNVTIITGPQSDYEPQYPWQFKEHWWGETAHFAECEFRAHVTDYDGDYSRWTVKHYGWTIASGKEIKGDHFSTAIEAAERALRDINAPMAPVSIEAVP